MSAGGASACESVEEAADEVINPIVWGALTPRITDLNLEYFGFMWPNNAGAGCR